MVWEIKTLNTSATDFDLWSNYYNRLPKKGIYHSPRYIKILERHYQDEAELFLFGNEQEFVYYPYFKRRLNKLSFAENCDMDLSRYFDIVSSWYYGGPLLCSSHRNKSFPRKFLNAFSAHARQEQLVSEFIRFDPNLKNHLPFENISAITKNREAFYIDLRQPEDLIWMNMEGRARTAIRKAKKLNVEVHQSEDERDLAKFCDIYAAEMERKEAPRHYIFGRDFFHELFNTLGEKIVLFYAKADGIFISSGLFVYETEETAHYYLMATHHGYNRYQANNLILYEAMLYFKKKGVKTFDFQGGRNGVAKFKKSFTNTSVNFFTCGRVFNQSVYDRLVRCKNEFYRADGSFFPEYRVKDTN